MSADAPTAAASPTTVCGAEPVSVVTVPSALGLGPGPDGGQRGVHLAPTVLMQLGLLDGVDVRDVASMPVPEWQRDRDPRLLVRNPDGVREVADATAQAVRAARQQGRFVLVLGGDCSVLLGSLLGLRRSGRHGLVFLDGHADFYVPRDDLGGGIAGMDLALATGRGPAALADWHGLAPLVRDEDVAVVGFRDQDEATQQRMPPLHGTAISASSLLDVRAVGTGGVVEQALRQAAGATDGFFVHLDVDVLDDAVMPAVDSRQPGGLRYDELLALLDPLLAHPAAVGLEVTIYDPSLDRDRRHGAALARELNRALLRAGQRRGHTHHRVPR